MSALCRYQFAKTFLRCAVGFALVGCSVVASADQHRDAEESWGNILKDFVDEQGRTDFQRLADQTGELNELVGYLATHGPQSNPGRFDSKEKILAFHINAYNALAMHAVIEKGIPSGFNNVFKRAGFFRFRKISIDGQRMSLSAYENEVIRPLDEPRVHFALNCMVKDCPRLPQEPFLASDLDVQLASAAREFFNQSKHLVRMPEQKRVAVSKILDFYTEDFVSSGESRDLIHYINQFVDEPIPADWTVAFKNYDWTINQQPE